MASRLCQREGASKLSQTLTEEAPPNPAPTADGASAAELLEKEKEKRNETFFGVELPADLTIDEKLRRVPPVKVRACRCNSRS